jgi:hypothetical protein
LASSGTKGENNQFVASTADFDSSISAIPIKSVLSGRTVYLIPVQKTQTKMVDIPDLDLSLFIPAYCLYGDGFIDVSHNLPSDQIPIPPKELDLRSKVVRLGPLSLALRTAVEIDLFLDMPVDEKEAVYRLNEKKKEWAFLHVGSSQSHGAGHRVGIQARKPGVYAVFADRMAPTFGNVAVRKHRMYADGRTFPEIVIELDDSGSGIDNKKTKVFLDGRPQVAQWDSFAKKMFVLLREQNIIGDRKLTVKALDRVGNDTTLETNIIISKDHFSKAGRRNGEHVK